MTAPTPLPLPFTLTTPSPTLLTQGAEALVYHTHFLTPSSPSVLKHRPSKSYRHPVLDKRLTRHRILSEARTLVKCRREGVSVPAVLALDAEGSKDGGGGWMMMEYIEGVMVKEALQKRREREKTRMKGQGDAESEKEDGTRGLMGRIGTAVGRLHEVGVVHGDLTTSNMMIRPFKSEGVVNGDAGDHVAHPTDHDDTSLMGEIVLIDFGLATQSLQDEDKAVDLYVLERAFGSTHPEAEEGFREVLMAYGESYKGAKVVLKRLEDVRMRGRKRSMLG